MPRDLGWVEDHVAAPGTIGLLSGATIHQPAYRETRPGRQLPGRWITPMGLQFRLIRNCLIHRRIYGRERSMKKRTEAHIDSIVATYDGDLRGALKALMLVNEHFESQLERLHATGSREEAALTGPRARTFVYDICTKETAANSGLPFCA
jgi:hypothetical protein